MGEVYIQLLLCSGRAAGVGYSRKHEALPSNAWSAAAANRQEHRNQWNWADYTLRRLLPALKSAVVSALVQCVYKCFAGQTNLCVDHWIPVFQKRS